MPPPANPFTIVQDFGSQTHPTFTITANSGRGLKIGDFLMLFVYTHDSNGSNPIHTVSDSNGNPWTVTSTSGLNLNGLIDWFIGFSPFQTLNWVSAPVQTAVPSNTTFTITVTTAGTTSLIPDVSLIGVTNVTLTRGNAELYVNAASYSTENGSNLPGSATSFSSYTGSPPTHNYLYVAVGLPFSTTFTYPTVYTPLSNFNGSIKAAYFCADVSTARGTQDRSLFPVRLRRSPNDRPPARPQESACLAREPNPCFFAYSLIGETPNQTNQHGK